MSSSSSLRTGRVRNGVLVAPFVVALFACAAEPTPRAGSVAAKGEIVRDLDDEILQVFEAKNGDYWFGSKTRAVYRFDGAKLVKFTIDDGLLYDGVGTIQEDAAGNVYFPGGVLKDAKPGSTQSVSQFDGNSFHTWTVDESDGSGEAWVLRSGDLWFGGGQDSGAVLRFDGKKLHRLVFPTTKAGDAAVAKYPRSKYPNAKFSPYDVYIVFKDSTGSLWFGTATLGACRYDGKNFAWLDESELRNGSFGTRSIVEDKDGRFWFCDPVHRYEVDLTDPTGPMFVALEGVRDKDHPEKPLFEGVISSVMDDSGALWMATYGQGVWRVDGKQITHFSVQDRGEDITLFTIHKDLRGVMWLGTHQSGAYRFDGTAFEKFNP